MSKVSAPSSRKSGLLNSLGPAIIVASVVLGPGSILTSSKVGCQYGYTMLWVVAFAGLMMFATTALAARLGVALERTPCAELAVRGGRPFAGFIGVTVFLIVACFQSSNNIAVLSSIEPLLENKTDATPETAVEDIKPDLQSENSRAVMNRLFPCIVLLAFNGFIISVLYGFKQLYRPVEWMMKFLVMLMIIAFAANLLVAKPSLLAILGGLVPRPPSSATGGLLPTIVDSKIVDPLWAIQALIATTFSAGGAFYQSYLVREKGWNVDHLRQGLTDSLFGIVVLAGISAMIMLTSASVLHGVVPPEQLKTAVDVGRQIEPLFGQAATVLFSAGIFAAALSSFLMNAMIGGTMLSDGLGLGSSMDQPWPKRFTVVALLSGMVVAIASTSGGMSRVGLIIFAQALTVLGGPILVLSMFFLANSKTVKEKVQFPFWMVATVALGCVVTLGLAVRTAWRIYLQLA